MSTGDCENSVEAEERTLAPIRKAIPKDAILAPCCTAEQPRGDVDVYIFDYVFEGLQAFVARDTRVEQGGVLIGQVCKDLYDDIDFIQVVGFVPAKGAVATSASIRFTVEAWSHIARERSVFGDLPIVGWVHSHPGIGIFLSHGMDTFVHKHWFPYSWQVAMVIDPLQSRCGLFGWRNGKLLDEPMKFYLTT